MSLFCKILPDPQGEYITREGERCSLEAVRRVRSRNGVNVGYTCFSSLEDAMEHWGLVRVPPEAPPTDEQIS